MHLGTLCSRQQHLTSRRKKFQRVTAAIIPYEQCVTLCKTKNSLNVFTFYSVEQFLDSDWSSVSFWINTGTRLSNCWRTRFRFFGWKQQNEMCIKKSSIQLYSFCHQSMERKVHAFVKYCKFELKVPFPESLAVLTHGQRLITVDWSVYKLCKQGNRLRKQQQHQPK